MRTIRRTGAARALLLLPLVALLAAGAPAAAQFVLPDDPAFGGRRTASFDELNRMLERKLASVREIVGGSPAAALLGGGPLTGAAETTEAALPAGLPRELNVLVLGLDRRMNWKECHADAIHLFTFDLAAGTIEITTVPRGFKGFKVPGRPGAYAAEAYYYGGRDLMRACVESHLGRRIDYLVEFDFSGAMRALELIGYEGKTALRFLRHRKSYGPGDYQRCHNQALFMKHQIARVLPYFRMNGGELLLRAGLALVWTDMPESVARGIILALLRSGIERDPDRIALSMKPDFRGPLRDDEVPDPEDMDAKVAAQYEAIGPGRDRSPAFSMGDHLFALAERLAPRVGIDDAAVAKELGPVFERMLWNQVESFDERRRLHHHLAEIYAAALTGLGEPELAEACRREAEAAYALRDITDLPEMDAARRAEEAAQRAEEERRAALEAAEAERAREEAAQRALLESSRRQRSGSRFGPR